MKLIPNQAVILAGGQGERLRPLTNELPKPMVNIKNYPFLDYLINSLINIKIKKILILVGYKGEKIIERYSNMKNIIIEFSKSDEKSLTGKRLIDAQEKLDDIFLLLYGDNYWEIEWKSMLNTFNKMNCPAMTTVYSNINSDGEYGKSNNIQTESNLVIDYDKSRKEESLNGVEIGYFIIKKNIIDFDTKKNFSFEEFLLPKLIKAGKLSAYVTNKKYSFITDKYSLNNFAKLVNMKNYQPLKGKFFK